MIQNKFLLIFANLIILSYQISCLTNVAVISKAKGDVKIQKQSSSDWMNGKSGMIINSGATIRTGNKGFALIKYIDDKSLIKMRPKSELIIEGTKEKESILKKISVNIGAALFEIEKRQKRFTVETPTAVASVKGTKFLVQVSLENNSTVIFGLEGILEICNKDNKNCKDLTKNFKAVCTKGAITLFALPNTEIKDIEKTINSIGSSEKEDLKELEFEFLDENGKKKTVIIEYE